MADFPSVVLLRIFQFQSRFYLRYVASLVCKAWKLIAEDPLLWRKATVVIFPSAECCTYLSPWVGGLITKGLVKFSFHRHCSRTLIREICKIAGGTIKQLSISGSQNVDDIDIFHILSQARSIEKLLLPSCGGFFGFTKFLQASTDFTDMQDLLPVLTDIDIGHTTTDCVLDFPLSFLQGLNANTLQSLGVSGLSFPSAIEPVILDLLRRFKVIKKLDFSFTTFSENFLVNFAVLELFYLEELNIIGCQNITPAIVKKMLFNFGSLKRMFIKNIKEEMSYINLFDMISRSSGNLECLRFNNSWVQPNAEKYLQAYMSSQLKRTSSVLNLRRLDLSYCPVGENFLVLIARNLMVVESLSLSSCGITDAALLDICKQFPSLKEMDISRNRRITDFSFTCDCKYDQIKESLSSANHLMWTQKHLDTVCEMQCRNMSSMHSMEVLSIGFLTKLTDVGLMSILFLGNLRSLSLRGCCNLTSTGRCELYQKCSLLTWLDLSELKVDDREVQFMAESLKYITVLNLSGTFITDGGLDCIALKCQCLRDLNISNCEYVSEGKVRDFIKTLKSRLAEFKSSYNVAYELVPSV